MSRFRPSGLAVVATLFVVAGLVLMLASLRIESTRTPSAATAETSIVIPTTSVVAANSTVSAAPSDPKAERLFARAQTANRTLSYGGVKEVSRWVGGASTTAVIRVVHAPGRGTVVYTSDADNPANTGSTVAVEPDAASERATLTALVGNYRLVAGESTVVLDRDADVLDAIRPDGSLAARFWLDRKSGLVLRRELLDSDNQMVESASFLDINFVGAAPAEVVPTPASAWSVMDQADVVALRSDGWTVPQTLAGGLRLYQVRSQTDGDNRTVQLAYTDGLFGVSVFVQRGALDRDAMTGYVPVTVDGGEVWARSGSMFYTWQSRPKAAVSADGNTRDIVVSATADSPNAPVGAAFAAFPPLPAEDSGVGDHVTRGVQRVGSWFDPLG